MCQFSKKSERVKIFFVDLVWNDPKLIQLVPPVNVKRDRSKPINILKRSLEEECHDSAPNKKIPRKDAAVDLESLVMCNDGSEERIWLKFGRQTLTEMDKMIIVKGVCVCVRASARTSGMCVHMYFMMCCIVLLQAKC